MKINYFKYKMYISRLKTLCIFLVFNFGTSIIAQEANKEKQKVLKESKEFLSEANYEMENDNFFLAEAAYREAIATNPEEDTGKYNLGIAYYDKEMNDVAMSRFKQAAAVADTKSDKHKVFHNLGNTFMNEKLYKEAVESYKNALRNNPKDEETRYNYALAKELLEEQEKNSGGDDNKENQENQEDKQEEEKKENQDNKNNKKNKEDGDQKNEQNKGEEEQDKKEGNENEDKGKPEEPNDKKQQQQPTEPGKLSPQQVKNLLEAMNNEEKKVQEKINAKKQKGTKVKPEKDW
jgi:Ca-activated chloride channel family protein